MAIFGQSLTKFEHDAFVLEFTITDATINITSTTHCAWWCLGNNSDVNSVTSLLLEGQTISAVNAYNISVSADGCSATPSGGSLSHTTSSPSVTLTTNKVSVNLTYDLFDNIADGSYAHELVLMDKSSTTCYQCRSTVAAVGVLTVNESMFTNYIYR